MKRTPTLITTLVLALMLAFVAGLSAQLPEGAAHAQDPQQDPEPQHVSVPQASLGTAFTYQGLLTDGGSPAEGEYDFQFTLHDDPTANTPVAGPLTIEDHQVEQGLFTVQLDFDQVFRGTASYLEIEVRPGTGAGAYTTLAPRHELTPVPYALALPGLWTQQNATSPNLIGGYCENVAAEGVMGATISGGGIEGLFGTGKNRVYDNLGVVGGGAGNIAGSIDATTDNASFATVGGGRFNTASNEFASVAGGHGNTASGAGAFVGGGGYDGIDTVGNEASGPAATIGGGVGNTASGFQPTIGGGKGNTADTYQATVSGGLDNSATNHNAAVGGGRSNSAVGAYATVGGGRGNSARLYATVPGGHNNEASGSYAFAAGRRAKANNQGCFVWGDSYDGDVSCNDDNRTIFRSTGGFYIYTGGGGGLYLAAGGSAWNTHSDRDVKENFHSVDTQQLLSRLAQVPITTWNYKAQDPSIRHIGPMAEDFNALLDDLGGEGEGYINTLDTSGVALAAIQGLYTQNQELAAENASQQAQIENLEARLAALERGGVSRSSAFGLPTWLLLGGLVLVGGVVLQRRRAGGDR
jgi:hypothetical protein